jgi:mRNA interferase RelE/StbE
VYRIEVAPAATRDLEALQKRIEPRDFERLRAAVRSLADTPRPHRVYKIQGTQSAYRIRVGAYRVVYEIFDQE